MSIRKEQTGTELLVSITGSLDTLTSPLLEKELSGALEGINRLIFDFSDVEYISSSGLRTLFKAYQTMGESGEIIIRHPNESVFEIFDITGSLSFLKVEQ